MSRPIDQIKAEMTELEFKAWQADADALWAVIAFNIEASELKDGQVDEEFEIFTKYAVGEKMEAAENARKAIAYA